MVSVESADERVRRSESEKERLRSSTAVVEQLCQVTYEYYTSCHQGPCSDSPGVSARYNAT